jgi:hypothetical protein
MAPIFAVGLLMSLALQHIRVVSGLIWVGGHAGLGFVGHMIQSRLTERWEDLFGSDFVVTMIATLVMAMTGFRYWLKRIAQDG